MDCNKEDAIKAMQLAERKMQVNDFIGARKLAQEAQQLFPGLENLSQLLAVCEVHYCAENKLGGCEMDWYGILQVQRFSHEAIVKKQFRKLEPLLHPGKNKFAGAEAAYKLIGEANAVLEDRGRHFRYDMKCRALLRTGKITSAHQSDENLFVLKHCDAAGNAQNILPSQYASTEEHQKGDADTFNTCCPFCRTVSDCAKQSANRLLLCQRCRRLFIASALDIQGMHPETLVEKFSNHVKLPNPNSELLRDQTSRVEALKAPILVVEKEGQIIKEAADARQDLPNAEFERDCDYALCLDRQGKFYNLIKQLGKQRDAEAKATQAFRQETQELYNALQVIKGRYKRLGALAEAEGFKKYKKSPEFKEFLTERFMEILSVIVDYLVRIGCFTMEEYERRLASTSMIPPHLNPESALYISDVNSASSGEDCEG